MHCGVDFGGQKLNTAILYRHWEIVLRTDLPVRAKRNGHSNANQAMGTERVYSLCSRCFWLFGKGRYFLGVEFVAIRDGKRQNFNKGVSMKHWLRFSRDVFMTKKTKMTDREFMTMIEMQVGNMEDSIDPVLNKYRGSPEGAAASLVSDVMASAHASAQTQHTMRFIG